ncbi:methylthioribulose 1-phosphate dehydratase [Haliangium ochraceum]|uniref:Methylthioribulose-1-phosphate dehydratase n=1 Tax=Haliangium ochraceum (strain DSM 14365 / JCM 11303 / SMP-2) TaxID=502025 RepID=D0LL25_HALO1|nr:methylthioribulose 1-phosphate dehydratase [Haliangium ochraceum]ACY16745.1 methylthioribulose-1-phosphate dehydratase [Haliangium ochraceum DSM 14365]
MQAVPHPRALIAELCRHLYQLGWVSGTGGGISVKDRAEQRIYMAPSGVQKERMTAEDMFVLDAEGEVLEAPTGHSKLSECAPLFMHAYRKRDAGAVIHSHSVNAVMATLAPGECFEITHVEMMKGIRGHGYRDRLRVPIIDNTAREAELSDALAAAIDAYPDADAVLVRRHGVYVWGRDWAQAKTQAECYDYLFELATRMRQAGYDPAEPPQRPARRAGFVSGESP